jgi:hypothetical protein
MDKVQFPAVVICSRWDHADDAPVAFVGCDPIHSDAELERRLAQFRYMEESGGHSYTYTLANVADADAVIAERIADLEMLHRRREQAEAGDAAPAPEPAPIAEDPNHKDHTTNGDQRQVALVVGYAGAFPPPPQTFATGELMSYILDGNEQPAPAHSLAETRLWLTQHGFSPDYVRWQALDRQVPDGQRRKRLEVWTGGDGDEPEPPTAAWWGAECATPRRDVDHLEALAQERGGNGRKPDEPFIPESGWGYAHGYPWAKGSQR